MVQHSDYSACDLYQFYIKGGVCLFRGCVELCLGVDDEPNENLWVRITERSSMGDFVVSVSYRLPDQDEQVDEVFYRQLKVASCL